MKLADLTLPISYADGRSLALVFTPQLAERLAELYALHGRPDCRATPRQTTDGRWFLTADILTATEPGGYLHEMWQHADKSILLPAVEVLPIADALALLPSDHCQSHPLRPRRQTAGLRLSARPAAARFDAGDVTPLE